MYKSYCVCIPTAGLGTRLEKFTKNLNKSLIDLNNTPIISHIINKFPKNTDFVIPLGYKGNLVRNYLKLAHPDSNFFFSKVKNFSGKNSGLGLSLINSQKYLQRPFIFISCDTLVKGKILIKNKNWVGYSNSKTNENYRKIKIDKKKFVKFFAEKKDRDKSLKNYIGLAEIKDFKNFWDVMNKNKKLSVSGGEFFGLKNLNSKIKAFKFNWNDVGNFDQYLNNTSSRLLTDKALKLKKQIEKNVSQKAS